MKADTSPDTSMEHGVFPSTLVLYILYLQAFKDRQQEAERDLQCFTLFFCYCKDINAFDCIYNNNIIL